MKTARMDRQLLISTLLLAGAGFLIFMSASLGLLSRDSVTFGSIAFRQIFFGLVPGLIALYFASRTHYLYWRKISFWIFLLSIVLNILILIPWLHIGFSHGGATRWMHIGSFTLQTSELLKVAAVLYFAAWLSSVKERVATFKEGFLPLMAIIVIVSVLLLLQPDHDTLVAIIVSLMAMYMVAGGQWRWVGALAVAGVLGLGLVYMTSPYIASRINTFVHPSQQAEGAGYQIQQSLIAVGSGGVTGRGFGQSIQKFNYLPEPVGDSIFPVAAEEFGLMGCMVLIGLFLFFTLRSFVVASRANSPFGGYVIVGITTFMICQAFINIGSMIGILPLAGIPLPFVSQGGTALLFALGQAGIMLNISRYMLK
ncbi:MAG: putative peptidoglycan glycosyltransferase FtsW [Candidatus Paceibacterota bacterium]